MLALLGNDAALDGRRLRRVGIGLDPDASGQPVATDGFIGREYLKGDRDLKVAMDPETGDDADRSGILDTLGHPDVEAVGFDLDQLFGISAHQPQRLVVDFSAPEVLMEFNRQSVLATRGRRSGTIPLVGFGALKQPSRSQREDRKHRNGNPSPDHSRHEESARSPTSEPKPAPATWEQPAHP